MKISFIGMSGTGKSHWSKKLEKKGFKRFCIDDLIEEKLGKELKRLGYSGINDVARWMGQPYDPQYKKTSKKYLEFERESLLEVFSYLQKSQDEDIVIDTTGSVIYTGEGILGKLSSSTKIVYLQTPHDVTMQMYKLYIKDPKPVIWGDAFQLKNGENNMDALKRCYPELLAYRIKQYEKLADITIDYYMLRKKDTTIDKFITAMTDGLL